MCALFTKAASGKPAKAFSFRLYQPTLQTDQLVAGIDNVRFDVVLSSKFMDRCRSLLFQLIVKHSDVSELLQKAPAPLKPTDKREFKELLQDLLVHVLNRANSEKNPQLELLAHAAVFKYLAGEFQAQYAAIVVEAREKLKLLDRPGSAGQTRGYQLKELLGNFQKNKRIILLRGSRELLDLVQDVRNDVVRKTRESFFGSAASVPHAVLQNPLLFTEDGHDDFLYLEHYCMLGNFQRDPDRFELVDQQARSFVEWADGHSEESREYRSRQAALAETTARMESARKQQETGGRRSLFSLGAKATAEVPSEALTAELASAEEGFQARLESFRLVEHAYSARLDQIVGSPDNALQLVDFAQTEQQISELRGSGSNSPALAALQERAEQQRDALERLTDQFARAGLIPYILGAYEAARIYQDFCPPINPQQLKVALVDEGERSKVAHLVREYRLRTASTEMLEEAAWRIRDAGAREQRAVMARFLVDFFRCQQDLANFRTAQNLMERIHLPTDPKQRELSRINNTLYEFLLAAEEKPVEDKVASHVILKADIRDSTGITAQLFARNLNPASYFSLNFFDPVGKLLTRYGATKVFLEGDALILALMEREGHPARANSVARACSLAREMVEVVRAVNDQAMQNQLPLLELGIGVCFQPAAPMYLMDGDRPIMISKALNESDRLSGCGKLAKQILGQKKTFFNVAVMQLLPDTDSQGSSEEFLLHYNVHGIEISEPAFEKLAKEISLSKVELKLPIFGEPEQVELFCGSLPLGTTSFQKIVVRRGRVPQLHPKNLRVVEYTPRCYYEVCHGKPIYDYVGKQLGW
jgi:hypothetical protein